MDDTKADHLNQRTTADIQREILLHKSELDRVGRWVAPKLELVRPYIFSLIKTGISIPVLKTLLEEVYINTSERHLRKHIKRMFPESYESMYSRRPAYKLQSNVKDQAVHVENEKKESGKMEVEKMLIDIRNYRGTGD